MPQAAKPLRLLAEDADDLAVVSAALQDAVAKIGDIAFDAAGRRLTVALNRFRWEAGEKTRQRVRTGLQIGGVLGVRSRKLRRDAKGAIVELLSLAFEPGEAPGGVVVFTFAGGGDLRVEVECLDLILADVSDPWPTPRAPAHDA
ncbi:DUF2948 family protein [Caulobacter mirabilis]|uniref:DUF2948 domain-containing protein n=1 Tax=Caulobacter mirabilis TaxID=69666 RepID=A0A2D2AZX3_9CAUL|nr:DUF2948 family protein [Caulobacter mirabilis]ATQ43534.1 hypothetical protein CSW64_14530 [Caulobacter mirabilis]